MKISVWPSQVPGNGMKIYRDLISYMSKTDQIVESTNDADAALIWSVLWNGRMSRNHNVWKQYRGENKPVIVIEVGGLIRNQTWRLSINGINRSATFPAIKKFDNDRPKKLNINLKPWHDGKYVLICGQHGKSEQWRNMPPMDEYYKQTVLEIRKYTQKPIVIRSHPRYREKIFFNIDTDFYREHHVEWNVPKHIHQTYDSFDLEPLLAHCHCTISHSSNSGLSSIIEGTPAIVSEESLAYDVANADISSIENLLTPNREQWLIELCHKEWFEEELEQAWLMLRDQL
jgi:predicted protein tyrosine phosphatase